jgi:hypothetical protein
MQLGKIGSDRSGLKPAVCLHQEGIAHGLDDAAATQVN